MAADLATAEATGIPTGTVARIVVTARTTTPVTIPTGMRKPSGLAIGSVLLASLFISFPLEVCVHTELLTFAWL